MDSPQKHHYVPVHLLKAFTIPTQHNKLWVFDSARRERNVSSPKDCGCVKHFNRVDPETHPDPMAVENAYAKIEDKIAPVIQVMRDTNRAPSSSDRHFIPILIALQMVRTPRFRRRLDGMHFKQLEAEWRKYSRNKASRRRFMQRQKKIGVPEYGKCESYGHTYNLWSPEEYIAYLKCGDFSITTDNNWKMAIANEVMQSIVPVLAERTWSVHRFDGHADPLIIGDSGVGLAPLYCDGPQAVGLGLASTVVYLPISPSQALVGYTPAAKRLLHQSLSPLILNTTSFAWSESQCFSSTDNFTIDDPERGHVLWSVCAEQSKFPKLASDPGDLAAEYFWKLRNN